MSPAGRRLDQELVRALSSEPHLTILCGRYEGVDERVVDGLPAEEISIGDYVLSGRRAPGARPDRSRHPPRSGVIGKEASHEQGLVQRRRSPRPSHYTRPQEFRGMSVPEVLVSGNHGEVDRWRRDAAIEKTRRNRPDLTNDASA